MDNEQIVEFVDKIEVALEKRDTSISDRYSIALLFYERAKTEKLDYIEGEDTSKEEIDDFDIAEIDEGDKEEEQAEEEPQEEPKPEEAPEEEVEEEPEEEDEIEKELGEELLKKATPKRVPALKKPRIPIKR